GRDRRRPRPAVPRDPGRGRRPTPPPRLSADGAGRRSPVGAGRPASRGDGLVRYTPGPIDRRGPQPGTPAGRPTAGGDDGAVDRPCRGWTRERHGTVIRTRQAG